MRHKYYLNLQDVWDNTSNIVDGWFENCHWFDGTLTYTKPDGTTSNLLNLNYDGFDLASYWVAKYGELDFGIPLKNVTPFSSPAELGQAKVKFYEKVGKLINNYIKSNDYRYRKLMETLSWEYDPLYNYDMVERRDHLVANGTVTQVRDQDTTEGGTDLNTQYGKINEDSDYTQTEDVRYTTTYDDANIANSRAEGKETHEFLNASEVRKSVDGDNVIPFTRKTTDYGSSEQNGLKNNTTTSSTGTNDITDTTTYGNTSATALNKGEWGENALSGNTVQQEVLSRKGNIGVMTAQDMVEKSRQLAQINLVDMMLEEISKIVLLQNWD